MFCLLCTTRVSSVYLHLLLYHSCSFCLSRYPCLHSLVLYPSALFSSSPSYRIYVYMILCFLLIVSMVQYSFLPSTRPARFFMISSLSVYLPYTCRSGVYPVSFPFTNKWVKSPQQETQHFSISKQGNEYDSLLPLQGWKKKGKIQGSCETWKWRRDCCCFLFPSKVE